MKIRRATLDDAGPLAELYLVTRDAAAMPPGLHPLDDVTNHLRTKRIGVNDVWVAEDGEPIGFLILEDDDLHWLFVHPSAQGRGVGTTLVDLAKAERPGGLALWVFEMNLPARDFYAKHGFVEVRRTDGDNEEGAPDVRMTWGAHPEAS